VFAGAGAAGAGAAACLQYPNMSLVGMAHRLFSTIRASITWWLGLV